MHNVENICAKYDCEHKVCWMIFKIAAKSSPSLERRSLSLSIPWMIPFSNCRQQRDILPKHKNTEEPEILSNCTSDLNLRDALEQVNHKQYLS